MLKYTVVLIGGMFAFMALAPEPEGRIFGDKTVVSKAELVSAPVETLHAAIEPTVAPTPIAPVVAEVTAPRAYVAPAPEVVQMGATAAPIVPDPQTATPSNVVLAAVTISSKPVPRPNRDIIQASTPIENRNFPVWFVTGQRVNVREGPSTDFAVLGSVIYGEAAEVVADSGGEWVKIRIEGDGVEGFIARRFMSKTEPAQ